MQAPLVSRKHKCRYVATLLLAPGGAVISLPAARLDSPLQLVSRSHAVICALRWPVFGGPRDPRDCTLRPSARPRGTTTALLHKQAAQLIPPLPILHLLKRSAVQGQADASLQDAYLQHGCAVLEADSGCSLAELGIQDEDVLTVCPRLRGGKGGFGALLRGAGRAAATDNFDAYRDLSGRRLRHVNADERLRDWARQSKEMQRQLAELKRLKDEEKASKRAAATEVKAAEADCAALMTLSLCQACGALFALLAGCAP